MIKKFHFVVNGQFCLSFREFLYDFIHLISIYRVGITNTQLSYKKVARTIARKKSQRYPNDPTIQEIQQEFLKPEIMTKYGYTLDGNAKFYMDTIAESDYQFTVFCSDFVRQFVEKNIDVGSRKYLIDGTFDNLPVGYYQLMIVSIEYQNDVS